MAGAYNKSRVWLGFEIRPYMSVEDLSPEASEGAGEGVN